MAEVYWSAPASSPVRPTRRFKIGQKIFFSDATTLPPTLGACCLRTKTSSMTHSRAAASHRVRHTYACGRYIRCITPRGTAAGWIWICAGAHATDLWYFLRYSDRNGPVCNRFFIYWLTLQMGYIDRPVDWLQYALKIRAYTNFFDKVMVI